MPVYKQEDGFYGFRTYVKLHDGTLKKINRRGTKLKWNKKDATEALARFTLENNEDLLETITFEKVALSYLAEIKMTVSESTQVRYNYIVNTYLIPYFRKSNIHKITPKKIMLWKSDHLKYGFTFQTNKRHFTTLSSVFKHAMQYYGLPNNPCTVAGGFKNTEGEHKEIEFWTRDEFKIFISSVDDPKYRFLFNTFYYSGVRRGELIAFNWNDFNLSLGTISVTKTETYGLSGTTISKKPKTKNSQREISMPQFWIKEAKKYKKLVQSQYDGFSDNFYVFGDIKYIARSTLARYFTKYTDKANDILKEQNKTELKKIRIHDLRHSHASYLIEMGVNPLVISKRLGHSDVAMTLNRYSHLYPNADGDVAQLINKKEGK